MNLEQDLLDFLEAGKKLEYDYDSAEPGFVGLCKPSALKEGVIWMEGPSDEDSYYEIPAISLSGENEYYKPEFILCWLPNEKKYATWDCDHWDLLVFENESWALVSLTNEYPCL